MFFLELWTLNQNEEYVCDPGQRSVFSSLFLVLLSWSLAVFAL